MFSTLFQPCEVKLHLLQNAVFLHTPQRPLPESHQRPPQANDELVRGLVELHVPTNRHIAGIRVRLKAVQTVAILDSTAGLTPVSWEDTTILEKVVDIGISHDKERIASNFNQSSASVSPGALGSSEERGRSAAAGTSRASRGTSAFGLRSSSPGGSIPASMARAVSRGRRLASGMGRISHTPSPSNSRQGSRAPSPIGRSRSTGVRQPPPPSYAQVAGPVDGSSSSASSLANTSLPPTPGNEAGPEVILFSNPSSYNPTPHISRRPSLSNANSPSHEREQLPFYADIAAHLRQSLVVHAEQSGRRSASATTSKTADKGKVKSSSTSVGWTHDFFGTKGKGARSKSRASSSRNAEHEEEARGRRGASKARGEASIPQHALDESAWENEPREDGLELQKGVHGFEFAFIIPCDAPPYERSPFGKVRYIVKATAIGAGRAKSNVECWRELYPMVNPSHDGEPTPLTVLYNDLHPTVGLLSIACTSNNISVGGVFNIDINSPTPSSDLIVYLVRVSLETTIELHTKKKGKQIVPTQRHKVFEKGWVPPKNPDGCHGDGKKSDGFIRNHGNDHAWTVQGVARIPDDNTIRASTVAGSKASVRFSHVLVVEIVHSRRPPDSTAKTPEEDAKERRLKVFALRQPVLIPSCCCAYDAVTLPAYSAHPDPDSRRADMPWDIGTHGPTNHNIAGPNATNTGTPVHGPSHMHCVCGMSLQDLSEQERALIPTQPIEVLDGAHFRHQGKIGEIPSTARSPSSRGRRRSTSSTRTTTARSPSVISALRSRRGSFNDEESLRYVGGVGL